MDPVHFRARASHVPHVPAAARDLSPGGRARRGRERRAPLRQAARRRRRVARHLCVPRDAPRHGLPHREPRPTLLPHARVHVQRQVHARRAPAGLQLARCAVAELGAPRRRSPVRVLQHRAGVGRDHARVVRLQEPERRPRDLHPDAPAPRRARERVPRRLSVLAGRGRYAARLRDRAQGLDRRVRHPRAAPPGQSRRLRGQALRRDGRRQGAPRAARRRHRAAPQEEAPAGRGDSGARGALGARGVLHEPRAPRRPV